MGLTDVEANKIRARIRELRLGGDPLKAMRVQQALDADEMPDETMMSDTAVKTDAPVKRGTDLTIPPRTGKGSGKKAWIEFAAKVTDIDPEVLSRMGERGDIIKMLEAKGNIPSE
jgi:hypothetical protein